MKSVEWRAAASFEKVSSPKLRSQNVSELAEALYPEWSQQMKQRRRGLQSLKRIKPPGGKSYLTAAQWGKILRDLQRENQAFGYEDERWTLARIQQLIHQQYGVRYNTNYLSKLHKSGWSVQQPARVAREREEALVKQWLQEHWPRVKKRPNDAKL